jgi:hypothetical protein
MDLIVSMRKMQKYPVDFRFPFLCMRDIFVFRALMQGQILLNALTVTADKQLTAYYLFSCNKCRY